METNVYTQNYISENDLFKTADSLRKNIDASEYKNIVLSLIFLHNLYLLHKPDLKSVNDYDKEERLEFELPPTAEWKFILSQKKSNDIGIILNNAMDALEKSNTQLAGILPKVFSSPNLDTEVLRKLIELIDKNNPEIQIGTAHDVLGSVYEYFLGEFAASEGSKGGQFYTPKTLVQLLVSLTNPKKGKIYDPCCGSGGIFVVSAEYSMKNNINHAIEIYGQESNLTTYKLCRMNMAIRGIDGTNIRWNNSGSFLEDAHPELKTDYIIANPPFNASAWYSDKLLNDTRWRYGTPPKGNANFAWLQHMIYHLSDNGIMACILANGSLSSKQTDEKLIRTNLIKAGLVKCIITLPRQLFYNTTIPACVWIISKKRYGNIKNNKKILFINASNLGKMISRTQKILDENDIDKITMTYKMWKNSISTSTDSETLHYEIKGFSKSVDIDEIAKNEYTLIPGLYVGIENTNENIAEKKEGITFLYIIKYSSQKIKIGLCKDLKKIIKKYESLYLKEFQDDQHKPYILHYEFYSDESRAKKREKELSTKAGYKKFLEKFHKGDCNFTGNIPFDEKYRILLNALKGQFILEQKLNKRILKNLKSLGIIMDDL